MTQVKEIIRAEQMREIASKNKTSYGLLLYLALQTNIKEDLAVVSVMNELLGRGVEVNEQHLYDAFQELEDLGLGSIIYAKRGEGDDTFKRDYNLNKFARRAFPVTYLHDWETKFSHGEVKLVDNNFRFQKTIEDKIEEKKSTGKVGRPAGYSLKLGRYFTPAEMAAREAKKANKRGRGRPVGWRKYPGQDAAVVRRMKSGGTGKRGRPKGYSPKLGRQLTSKELISKLAPKKRERPVGWRKELKVDRVVENIKHAKNPKMEIVRDERAFKASGNAKLLSIPLKNNREIRVELPKNITSDELALLKLNLDAML